MWTPKIMNILWKIYPPCYQQLPWAPLQIVQDIIRRKKIWHENYVFRTKSILRNLQNLIEMLTLVNDSSQGLRSICKSKQVGAAIKLDKFTWTLMDSQLNLEWWSFASKCNIPGTTRATMTIHVFSRCVSDCKKRSKKLFKHRRWQTGPGSCSWLLKAKWNRSWSVEQIQSWFFYESIARFFPINFLIHC